MALNESNKSHRKPIQNSEKVKFKQGYYRPENPAKCLTKQNIYRSSWEFFFCRWCDMNPAVIAWASEPMGIKYLNPIENRDYCIKQGLNPDDPHNFKLCTYYTDFWIELGDPNKPETHKRIFIEIKPHAQRIPPKPVKPTDPLKEHKRFKRETETYLVNQAKWAAAEAFFAQRNAGFLVVDELDLQKLGMNKQK